MTSELQRKPFGTRGEVHRITPENAGWRYVGFPGTRYDYRDFVGHNGARIDLPPVSLMGRPGWNSSE